jgi:hypothetical protein
LKAKLLGDEFCRFAYVGDTRRCDTGCMEQAVGPNGPTSADGIVSIIAHEISEVLTDPYSDAWCVSLVA